MAIGHVLIVEDEASILLALRMLLEMEGYRISEAGDGSEAIAVLARERPDLVITDYMMPGLNGGELVRRLRSDALLRELPVILISAVAVRDTGVQTLVDAYVGKPPDLDALLELVRRGVDGGRTALRATR